MSVKGSYSTCAKNLPSYRRAKNPGLRNSKAGPCSSFDFVGRKEGEKNGLHQRSACFPRHSLHLLWAEKGRRNWVLTVASQPYFQTLQAYPMRRNSSLTSASNRICLKPERRRSIDLKPERGRSIDPSRSHEGIRRPPRPAGLHCFTGKNDYSEERPWKNGPCGVLWHAEEIAYAVNGEVVTSAPPGSISTDSRRINEREWFLPLVGPNVDGHQFLPQALDRGCAGVIGRAVSADWPKGFIKVENDPLIVLHRLAASVRRRYGGPVVGITGSTGKTTARAMTALTLESLGAIHQTEGNFNNHIGLPITLLKLPSMASACVLEMGMSHPGELLVLAKIARPSVAVLLNVGPGHMENFGSLEDVAEAKGELLREARPGDVCVLNADDPLVMNLALPRGVRVVLFGQQEGCHLKLAHVQTTRGGRAVRAVLEQLRPTSTWVENFHSGSDILAHLRRNSTELLVCESQTPSTTVISHESHRSELLHLDPDQNFLGVETCSSTVLKLLSRVEFEIPSPGLHLARNACAAIAVAVSLGVPLKVAGKSISKYSPIGMRCRLDRVGAIQLIDDTYNSNPMSLESGLNLLGSFECQGERVALLGDMLELGSVSKRAHLDALVLCVRLKLDIVGLVGPSFAEAVRSQRLDKGDCSFAIFEDSEELAAKVMEILSPGDVVLVKGSRGMKMEIAANAIRTLPGLG